MAYDQRFAEPIALPDGRELVTVRQAAQHVADLPTSEQRQAHWQTAAEVLMLFAEGNGDPMLARIAMMQALNHGRPAPAKEPRRKRARVFRIIR